jgi:hypothetical protein
MKKQRQTNNLGNNQANKHELVYTELENKGIYKKKCSRSKVHPHPKYNFTHVGENPLSVREFNLQTSSKDGLQPNCRNCEKKFRRGRIEYSKNIYEKMTVQEIYGNYATKYGQDLKVCGTCHKSKKPSDFPISITMESGLHNMCFSCQKSYTESVGDRWIKFLPDGHTKNKPSKSDFCVNCSSTRKLQFDHKWPLAKGGTDHADNIKVLCQKCNSAKKTDISEFKNINEITPKHICNRYHDILKNSKQNKATVRQFEITISAAVQNYLDWKCSLTEPELLKHIKEHKETNNRKHSLERAVKKYKKYCSNKSL